MPSAQPGGAPRVGTSDSLETPMRNTTARLLKQLPNSWLFGVLWMGALTVMAMGAILSSRG